MIGLKVLIIDKGCHLLLKFESYYDRIERSFRINCYAQPRPFESYYDRIESYLVKFIRLSDNEFESYYDRIERDIAEKYPGIKVLV